MDESFDENYKLFKNQNGELFSRYISTNYRNGPPMKKIWVLKKCLENLPVNVIMTPQVKKTNPRPQASYSPKASYRQRTHLSRTNANVLQGNHTQANMSAVHQTAMFIRPRTILLILMSTIVRKQDFLIGLQSQNSQTLHLDLLLLSHP